MIFPDDPNGDVLRAMFKGGDSLRQARDIDFAHVFSTREAAETFGDWAFEQGFQVGLDEIEDRPGEPIDIIVTVDMAPEHQAITDLERRLAEAAERWGGRADGWGCFRIEDAVAEDSLVPPNRL
jgi:regulator of RNase E activity RraB